MPLIAIDRVSRGKHPRQCRQRSFSRFARDTLLPTGLKMRLNRSLMNLVKRQMPDAVTPKPQVLSIPINGLQMLICQNPPFTGVYQCIARPRNKLLPLAR